MVRDGWNFHNDIAMPLEHKARGCFAYGDRPSGKIFEADGIEQGHFVETLGLLLRMKTNYVRGNTEIDDFLGRIMVHFGKRGVSFEPEEAQNIYEEFRKLYDAL